MGRSRTLLLCAIALASIVPLHRARSQARYDDHELRHRFKLMIGGFRTQNTSTTLRVDSLRLGLGTILEVENQLNVEDSITGGRLDGYYRFNRASRIEWTFYRQHRKGLRPILNREIKIGGVVIPINYSVQSQLDFDISKIGYSWSFVNTSTYEMFLGAGLNVRNIALNFTGIGLGANRGDTRVYDSQEALPLPTLSTGLRYNVRDKMAIQFRTETFFIGRGRDRGRMQDTYLLFEYDFSKNFGIGGGLNAYNIDLEGDLGNGRFGKIESSYVGFLLYVSAGFR